MSQRAMDGGVYMPQGKGMQIFATAQSAYPSSVVIVSRKEPLERCGIAKK